MPKTTAPQPTWEERIDNFNDALISRMTIPLDRAIEVLGITATAEYGVPPSPTMYTDNMDGWTVTLRRPGRRRLTVPYYMGLGLGGKEPEAAHVLNDLALDAASIENNADFEDWCAEFGHDTDSRKAEAEYEACRRTARRLKRFLGEAYDLILWHTERL
jgi:hypothetical protein